MTRIVYLLDEKKANFSSTFDASLKKIGEYDAEDKALIVVSSGSVCVIHQCDRRGNKWTMGIFCKKEKGSKCTWTPSKEAQARADTLDRCGK